MSSAADGEGSGVGGGVIVGRCVVSSSTPALCWETSVLDRYTPWMEFTLLVAGFRPEVDNERSEESR